MFHRLFYSILFQKNGDCSVLAWEFTNFCFQVRKKNRWHEIEVILRLTFLPDIIWPQSSRFIKI